MDPPPLLRYILDELEEGRTERLARLALPVVLEWALMSNAFRAQLDRIGWWEQLVAKQYPVMHERLKRSAGRRANASALWRGSNVWRSLLAEQPNPALWRVDNGAQAAVSVADEFGVDRIHLVEHRSDQPLIRVLNVREAVKAFVLPSEAFWEPMQVAQLWTVPFQDAVLVLLRSKANGHAEAVWIRSAAAAHGDLSNWALNHNNMQEDPRAFMSPAFLRGDPTLTSVLLAATEGRTDIVGASVACAAVTVRQRDTLVFDQVKVASDKMATNWRALLSSEVWEPYANVTASCYVLDSLLLCAGNDGVLRAHPRGNPQSAYHVENFQSLVYQMVGLYNVVALIHSVDVLEVRRVERQSDDPFVRFELLYRATMVDSAHAPLLYGPYVVFRGVDGSWNRVSFESERKSKELIKVPHHAGWEIVAIKSANWRYWTLTLREPKKARLVDVFLITIPLLGSTTQPPPLFIARCIDCGARATHLCRACLNAAFCGAHGDSGHSKGCA